MKNESFSTSEDIFLHGHQALYSLLRFSNTSFTFRKAKLCIETTDRKKAYQFNLTTQLLSALKDNN